MPFVIEALQGLVLDLNRRCDASDVVSNLVGLAIGLVLGSLLGRAIGGRLGRLPERHPSG